MQVVIKVALQLTEPTLKSHRLNAMTGREISFEYVTIDEFMTYLKAAQTPKEYIDLLHYLFVSVLDGRNESIQGGVEEALGRAPKSFTEYIRENKKAWEI